MQHIPNLFDDVETFLYHTFHSISQVFEEQLLGNRLESTIYRKKRPKIYSLLLIQNKATYSGCFLKNLTYMYTAFL